MAINVPPSICLVCGYDFEFPYDIHDDCPCCGNQLSYYSTKPTLSNLEFHRNNWFNTGTKWAVKSAQPEGWDKEMALEQIRKNVPEEYQ